VRSRSAQALIFLEKALASRVIGQYGVVWLFSHTMRPSEMAQYGLDLACNEDRFIVDPAVALNC
jgi:hypothetical protein